MAPTNKENAKEDGEGLDYKQRRAKNNQAVKKSRSKTKMRTQQTLERMNQLKNENQHLGVAIRKLSAELNLLKSLFVHQSKSDLQSCFNGVDLNAFLADGVYGFDDAVIYASQQSPQ